MIVKKVKETLRKFNMLKKGDNVVVAISGGADSVTLLYALIKLKEELGIDITACHLNHNLRGEESNRDETFVKNLCKELSIKLVTSSVDVISLKTKHTSLEEAARKARYDFFKKISDNMGNCKICTAHTSSDNSETVLLNLIRGTALKGLCGIPPVRKGDNLTIIRPLITCKREEIEEFCKHNNIGFVTDSTNFSDEFTRNKIRLSIIPILKEMNSSFDEVVMRACDALRDDDIFLEDASKMAEINANQSVKKLKALDKSILCRIISRLLSQNNISPSSLRISQIIDIIEKENGKVNLKKHHFAVIEDEKLKIIIIHQNYR